MNTKQLTLRIPDEIYGALKEESKRIGISVSELILYAIDRLLDCKTLDTGG